jgi:hypothetical protein
MGNRALDVEKRFSGSAMPTTKPTIALTARPAGKYSPTEACRGSWERIGLEPWRNWKRLGVVEPTIAYLASTANH